MSRVIIFSRNFPVNHPRKGQPTFFVDKLWESIKPSVEVMALYYSKANGVQYIHDPKGKGKYPPTPFEPKHHTIRAGNRWKVGDKFSPRVWSGKPYASKQIIIAPDIELKKVWDVHIEFIGSNIHVMIPKDSRTDEYFLISAGDVAKNDGLDVHDFIEWFKIHPKKKKKFIGQILCWNDEIKY